MDSEDLAAACRPGVPADELVLDVLRRATADEYCDTGLLTDADAPRHIAAIYRRRVRHLARKGYLVVAPQQTLDDLDALEASGQPPRVVILIEHVTGGRRVYTAVLAGDEPTARACFVHDLPE